MPESSRTAARTALLAAACLPLAAAACAPAEEALDRRTVYDLHERFPFAEVRAELPLLQLESYAARDYLRHGWALPARDGDGVPDDAPLWSDAERAEVVLHLSERQPILLRTHLRALVAEGETNRTRVFLNGAEIAALDVPDTWLPLKVELDPELQRVGENLLAFEFEHCRTRSEVLDDVQESGMRFSVEFLPLRFRRTDARDAARVEWAVERLPEGATVRDRLQAVEQTSTATVAYHLLVPEAASFVAGLRLLDAQADEVGPATFRLLVATEDEAPTAVLEREVGGDDGTVAVEASLAPYAGEVARLSLELSSAGGGAVAGAWIRPLLLSAAAPPPEEEPSECVAELAAELDGAPVVSVLIDASHADFLSAYGGREGLTPHVDALADEGVLFERAHSVAGYTIASLASMLSDRFTWEHGTWTESRPLSPALDTWPESFREAGYRTIGIVHSINGSSMPGFDRGFERMIEVFRPAHRRSDAREVAYAKEALPHLDDVLANDDGRPLFLWLHLVEPHRPYTPPAPFAGSLASGIDSDLGGGVEVARKVKQRELVPTDDDLAHLRAIYEENLAYVDSIVGEVRRKLEARGIFDEAVVCLFSDHGEAFMQHDGKLQQSLGHGVTTYQEDNHIPLIFRLPSRVDLRGRRAETLASGMDVLPTLGELVGVAGPEDGRGRSLAPALCGDGDVELREDLLSHSYCARDDRFLPMWAYWWRDYKLVYHSGTLPGLYDLASDPGERVNLYDERPILGGFLLQRLQEELGFEVDEGKVWDVSADARELDQETLDQLDALGY